MDEARVLLVDDDDDLRHALMQGLEIDGFNVTAFADAREVIEHINTGFYGVIVSDMAMGGMDGNALLQKVMEIDASLPLILITGHGDVGMAVSSMRAGAYDFIEKPFATSALSVVILRAIEKRRLVLENRRLRESLDSETALDKTLIGRHPSIIKVRAQIAMLAPTDIEVLLTGESGTGKHVVARALHEEGPRKGGPFVAINCGALPKELLESELFGHEQGAFNSVLKHRVGKIEHANGGTLFLDEIETLPLNLQIKLLRVLENQTMERLGSNTSIALDIRLVAASKTDLKKLIPIEKFRSDLYLRLDVASINLPPLRMRGNDILVLFYYLTRKARARFIREIPDISHGLQTQLMSHDWPGNVRELRNAADRFVLGLDLSFDRHEADIEEPPLTSPLNIQMDNFERSVIQKQIFKNNGMLKPTYQNLKISRKSLYEKMKRLGLHKK